MPTKRAVVIFILALALYLVANQTQVGWVYLMVDALLGLLLVAFVYSLGLLRGLRAERRFRNLSAEQNEQAPGAELAELLPTTDFFEDDPLAVTLRLEQSGLRPAFLISGVERCPFAPPAAQRQSLFVPHLFRNRPAELTYHTNCDRRGVFTFAPLALRSPGPFNLFTTRRSLPAAGEILIYPRYHPLKRVRLLENRGFTDRHSLRSGSSSEVIGTREYRRGDSLRKIHWRSTARAGKLVVKEFADSDHLTITTVLDLAAGSSVGKGKFSTFETAVRIAASLGYYATHHNIPFRVAGHSQRWQPPSLALSWWGALHYLARVQNDGPKPLAEVLRSLPPLPFVVVLASNPDAAAVQEIAALPKRGIFALALLITPDGNTPLSALDLGSERLQVKAVSPHNWKETLEAL